jgi:hypothetical protein
MNYFIKHANTGGKNVAEAHNETRAVTTKNLYGKFPKLCFRNTVVL